MILPLIMVLAHYKLKPRLQGMTLGISHKCFLTCNREEADQLALDVLRLWRQLLIVAGIK